MSSEAKKTYKPMETEEVFDLLFFRPLASVVVKLVKNINFITPNLITIIGFILGILSLFFIFDQNYTLTLLGIALFTLSGILDCADGQLARLKGIQSQIGRILDGIADIFLFVAIYTFGYFTLLPVYAEIIDPFWVFVGASGLSTYIQASAFDYLKNDYIMISSKNYKSEKENLQDVINQFKSVKFSFNALPKKIGLGLYLFFTWSQHLYTSKLCLNIDEVPEEKRVEYIKARRFFLHLCKVFGPGTNIVIFTVCMFFQSFIAYVYIKLIYSNIYMIIVFIIQYFYIKRFSNNKNK